MLAVDTVAMIEEAALSCCPEVFKGTSGELADRLEAATKTAKFSDEQSAMLILLKTLRGERCRLFTTRGTRFVRAATVAEAIESASDPTGTIMVDGVEHFVEP